ncbi:MAG: hypothetical protein VW985_03215, partial [Gammaproteobacteria bacterium]
MRTVNLLWRGLGLLLVVLTLAIISLPRWLPVAAVNRHLAEITVLHLGVALQIQSLDWEWSGGPALALRGVSVGDRAQFETVELAFGLGTLTGKSLRRVTITDSEIDLPAWQRWIADQQQQPTSSAEDRDLFAVTRLRFRNVDVTPLSDYLGTIDGDIQFQHDWRMVGAELKAAGLNLGIQPRQEGYTMQATGNSWQLPASVNRPAITLGSIDLVAQWQPTAGQPEGSLHLSGSVGDVVTPALPFLIEKVKMDAVIEQRELELNDFEVTALGGEITANGTGKLDDHATLGLQLDLPGLALETVAQQYGWSAVAGKLSARATASLAKVDEGVSWKVSGETAVNELTVAGLKLDSVHGPFILDRQGVEFSDLD